MEENSVVDQLVELQGSKRDLILVVDHTQSMGIPHLRLPEFITRFVIKCIAEGKEIERVGFIAYDDHYPNSSIYGYDEKHYTCQCSNGGDNYCVELDDCPTKTLIDVTFYDPLGFKNYGLTENLEEFAYWVRNTPLGDGCDPAECFACSVNAAHQLSSDAAIWLITDAPMALEHKSYCFNIKSGMMKGVSVLYVNQANVKDWFKEWEKYAFELDFNFLMCTTDFKPC